MTGLADGDQGLNRVARGSRLRLAAHDRSADRQHEGDVGSQEPGPEAQSAVAAVDQAIAQRLGVNATDHRCMDILDQRGAMTAGSLATALGLSPSAVTTVIDRLEDLRYVRRTPNPADRRQVLVELTPLLRRRARELYGDAQEVTATLERYSPAELRLLRDFVRWDRERNQRRADRLTRQVQRAKTKRQDRLLPG